MKALAEQIQAADEVAVLRRELSEQIRRAEQKEAQLQRYAADLRETFKAERARADELRLSYEQLQRYAADLRETFNAERARVKELSSSYKDTVRALTNAVEARDDYTAKHASRVAEYGMALTRHVDASLATKRVEFGYLLHDVGKVAIPDGILYKADSLSPEEEDQMREHPVIGYEIVREIDFLQEAAQIVRHHHERWDGDGYPDGLSGEEIPLAARIFAVADTLDAMTTDRPYRPGAPLPQVREEIRGMAGSQFDPAVVAKLDEISDAHLERIRTAAQG